MSGQAGGGEVEGPRAQRLEGGDQPAVKAVAGGEQPPAFAPAGRIDGRRGDRNAPRCCGARAVRGKREPAPGQCSPDPQKNQKHSEPDSRPGSSGVVILSVNKKICSVLLITDKFPPARPHVLCAVSILQ